MKTKRSPSMWRCHTRQRLRCRATSGRSCSLALRLFFMRQAKPVQHVGDGRERLHRDPAGRKRRLDLTKRDPGLARHDGPQVVRMRLQQRTPVAADLGWCRAAGLAHPLHQLNGRRRADREATGRLPDRTTTFDGPHEPLTEVLGQGSGHNEPRCSRPQLPGIRTSDSVQLQTALMALLARGGLSEDEAVTLAAAVVEAAGGDPDPHKRRQAYRDACQKIESGDRKVRGFPFFKERFGEKVAERIVEWLDLKLVGGDGAFDPEAWASPDLSLLGT